MMIGKIDIQTGGKAGIKYNHFFISDTHLGASDTDEKKIKDDLENAMSQEAKIYLGGDWGEWIMKLDPRHISSLDKFAAQDSVQTSMLDYAEKFFSPYVENIVFVGSGNHEWEWQRRHGIDLTTALIDRLQRRRKNKTPILHGGYSGFIVLKYEKTLYKRCGANYYTIYYNHGQGSSSEITYGTIDLDRYMKKVNADLIWLQHKHQKVVEPSVPVLSANYFTNPVSINEKIRCGFVTGGYKSNINISQTPNYQERKTRGNAGYGGIMLIHELARQNGDRGWYIASSINMSV